MAFRALTVLNDKDAIRKYIYGSVKSVTRNDTSASALLWFLHLTSTTVSYAEDQWCSRILMTGMF